MILQRALEMHKLNMEASTTSAPVQRSNRFMPEIKSKEVKNAVLADRSLFILNENKEYREIDSNKKGKNEDLNNTIMQF